MIGTGALPPSFRSLPWLLLGAGGVGAVGLGSGGDAGPGLQFGAGEDALVTRMNEWGRRVDASLGLLMGSFSDLRGEVVSTQVVLATTIQEANYHARGGCVLITYL